ncbi:hypothetical protein CYMTET_17640 [Cymbomonas tetramitiformis]|uniref:Calx-beta domain-containing protein n=1 Tax=Cymbomonas tetramitiformis TaxID=36881 RepID=A0AAE0G9I7_9CHLO|nr:hypothetical protein CYMTET_17640 [Cymbomonas tetramitiformis]
MPVDQGAGREVKRDIDYEQNEWLEVLENLEKWENTELSASDRRILMTWWAGNGYKRTCGRVDFNRYFEKTGCLLDVNGEGDDKITPEGLSSFTFDRPIISAVLSTTPVQENLQSTSHAELEESVLREELAEEEELSDEDEGTDEAEKWFIPTGYLAELTAPPANQLNHSLVGWHLMFKWNGVGWCHGWVNKFYPKHRRGYNFEVVYEDGAQQRQPLKFAVVALTEVEVLVPEGSKGTKLRVTRSEDLTTQVDLDWETQNVGIRPSRFQRQAGRISFSPGEASQEFWVKVPEYTEFHNSELFSVVLFNVSENAEIGEPSAAIIEVVNKNNFPTNLKKEAGEWEVIFSFASFMSSKMSYNTKIGLLCKVYPMISFLVTQYMMRYLVDSVIPNEATGQLFVAMFVFAVNFIVETFFDFQFK